MCPAYLISVYDVVGIRKATLVIYSFQEELQTINMAVCLLLTLRKFNATCLSIVELCLLVYFERNDKFQR